MLTAINPWEPLIYKAHYDGFGPKHIEAAKEIMSGAIDEGRIFLEEGNARSSVSNQRMPPIAHPVFKDYFDWQFEISKEILLDKFHSLDTIPYWISNSWVNVHGKGGVTKTHSHGMSALSIAAYLQMPENGGYIEFRDPHYELRSTQKRSKNYDVQEYGAVPAITGDVLFFVGWIHHRTQPNQSETERWVLTTNYTSVLNKEMK